MFNLADFCLEPGAPDAEALVFVDAERVLARRTRAELRARVERLGRALAAHAPKGARIALRMTNTPAMAEAFLACAKAGLIAVPLSPELTIEETTRILDDAEASLVLVDDAAHIPPQRLGPPVTTPDAVEGAGKLTPTREEDPVLLIYTSGTGGRPKGVLHAHRSVRGRVPMRAGWLGILAGDRVLHAGTLNWTYTLGVGLMDPLSVGATAVLYGGKAAPGVWADVIAGFDIAVFAAVPTVYRRLLKYGDVAKVRTSRLKHGVCAGEPLSAELWRAWRDATGRELYEALGMTEISTYISSGPITPTRPGVPGKPQPGRRVAILDPDTHQPLTAPGAIGLLAVHKSDPGLMLGYWRQPDADAEVFFDDWFAGGDLAHFDADGYVHFHGRADDLMNALGVRTSPLEIERVLMQHDAVQEAAVTSLPNAEGVELITAFVVPAEGRKVDEGDLKAFAGEHLAAYKLPKRVIEARELPRTANGKIQRKRLGALLAPG
ncbi:MAG: acyl-CoA synthetase [Alphaproteobacteria bacterium]